jgi:hypothetical protein
MNEQQLREQLDAIYRSTSWRITSPIRWIGQIISSRHAFVPIVKKIVIQLARLAARNRTLLQIGTRIISVFPSIRHRLRIAIFIDQYKLDAVDFMVEPEINNATLTPTAHEISQQLFSAINSSNIKNKKNYSCE